MCTDYSANGTFQSHRGVDPAVIDQAAVEAVFNEVRHHD